jgi:hypothetical protein
MPARNTNRQRLGRDPEVSCDLAQRLPAHSIKPHRLLPELRRERFPFAIVTPFWTHKASILRGVNESGSTPTPAPLV